MNETLYVGIPYINKLENKTRLEAELKVGNGEAYTTYFEVEKKYGDYFTPEVSDYLLSTLLLYAMEHEYDLAFEGDISEDLYFRVTNYLIPPISKNIEKYKSIRISCRNLVNYKFGGQHIGTGLSCGVDSLYTILKNTEFSSESGLQLDSFSFFNVGSSGDFGGDSARELYQKRLAMSENVAQKFGGGVRFHNCGLQH